MRRATHCSGLFVYGHYSVIGTLADWKVKGKGLPVQTVKAYGGLRLH